IGEGLRSAGKEVTAFSHDAVPKNLRFLYGWQSIVHLESEVSPDEPFDLGIIVDVNNSTRVGRPSSVVGAAKTVAVIDHHQPGDEPLGDIRMIEPEASATCL